MTVSLILIKGVNVKLKRKNMPFQTIEEAIMNRDSILKAQAIPEIGMGKTQKVNSDMMMS